MSRVIGWGLAVLVAVLPVAASCAEAGASKTTWSASIEVDLDGDGQANHFRVGRRAAKVVVEAQVGSGKPQTLEFDAADLSCTPATFVPECDMPRPELSTYVLDEATIADAMMVFDIDSADIFVDNGQASVVVMPVGETDPLHFFWNAQTHQLTYTSL